MISQRRWSSLKYFYRKKDCANTWRLSHLWRWRLPVRLASQFYNKGRMSKYSDIDPDEQDDHDKHDDHDDLDDLDYYNLDHDDHGDLDDPD